MTIEPRPPESPAPLTTTEPGSRAQELQYLKQIAEHLNFIKSAIILVGILSLLGFAIQFCASLGLF